MTLRGWAPSRPRRKAPAEPSVGEEVAGRVLTPELFREELAGLGYDFEVYVKGDGKIWRFRRIVSVTAPENGDVW